MNAVDEGADRASSAGGGRDAAGCNGAFEPQIPPKHQTRFDGFDDKIISMYARGMTTREIQGHLQATLYEGASLMRHRFPCSVLLFPALMAVPLVRADVTLRYESKVTLNPNLPPQLAGSMTTGLTAGLPPTSIQQYRNGKLFYSAGKQKSIVDLEKREITVLDTDGKRYATAPVEQYAEAASRLITAATGQANAALAMMKGHSESTATGQKATIQGVEADQRDIVMTLDLSMAPGQPATPMVRVVLHVWTAKSSEAARNPALREAAGYNAQTFDSFNPIGVMQKAFQQIPGFADGLTPLIGDIQSGSVLMRMQMDLFVPMIGALMPAGNGARLDANAALMQMNYELTEISADPVPDSVFRIPEGYQSATVAEVLASVMPKAPARQSKPGPVTPAK